MAGFLSDNGIDLKIEHYGSISVMRHTHLHPQYELYFCVDDVRQRSVISGVEYTYKHPCVILSTPYTVHSMSCVEENASRYERYVFYFSDKTIDAFASRLFPEGIFERNLGLLFELTVEQAKILKDILLLWETEGSLPENELIFALFINKLTSLCPLEKREQIGTPAMYIQDVLQYISENFHTALDAENIAARFSVSRSKLDRDFKFFSGITVRNFIDICRINQAKYLLCRKNIPIVEVAKHCGFESETYFFPFFKKNTGFTPTQYRNLYSSQKNR